MKLGCILLFFALLFINFEVSNAVKCLKGKGFETVNCSSCVSYDCKKGHDDLGGYGCPEDFFQECAGIDDVEFIRSKNYNDLQYGKYDSKVAYTSGCSKETDGTLCILKKKQEIIKMFNGSHEDVCIEAGSPCVIPEYNDIKTTGNPEVAPENGASKIDGILGIGLMIFAWIF